MLVYQLLFTVILNNYRKIIKAPDLAPDLETVYQIDHYRQMAEYLTGQCDFGTAVENIKKGTRHFAKRQVTWYKKMPYIHWFVVDRNLNYEKIVTDMADTLVKSGKRM